MSIIVHRVSPQAARYTPAGGRERCGACRFYVSPRFCGKVIGPVSPMGWCKYFSQQMVGQFGGGQVVSAGGPSLDLSFMGAPLDPRITFTRASTATYTDASGVTQTAAINQPRWDYDPVTHAMRGLLIEEARTNLLLNSATLGTQGVVVTAQAYTLSFYGTGTMTKSGAATGALVGTGATQRVSQTFTPTAGTVTCTVTGSVTNAQIEAGAFPTSYIPTTSAAVLRAQDNCAISSANMAPWYASPGGSWFAEFIDLLPSPMGTNPRILAQYAAGGVTPLWETSGGRSLATYDGVVSATANGIAQNVVSRAASNWTSGTGKVCLNGATIGSGTMNTGFAALAISGVGILQGSPGVSAEIMTGYIRRVQYWPRVLSDAEMQAVTT
jgi:hypothetical protein